MLASLSGCDKHNMCILTAFKEDFHRREDCLFIKRGCLCNPGVQYVAGTTGRGSLGLGTAKAMFICIYYSHCNDTQKSFPLTSSLSPKFSSVAYVHIQQSEIIIHLELCLCPSLSFKLSVSFHLKELFGFLGAKCSTTKLVVNFVCWPNVITEHPRTTLPFFMYHQNNTCNQRSPIPSWNY